MLSVYTVEQSNEWDAIVKTFKHYDTFWLSGYTKAFRLHGEGEPLLVYYEDREIKGINVVMKRDIAKCELFEGILPENTYFDFSTPYGYGGWLIQSADEQHSDADVDPQPLFKAYEDFCKQNGVVSEFVRFHPVIGNHAMAASAYETVVRGPVVTMETSDVDEIWENITSKNRNVIRKAQKNGVKICCGRSKELFEEFRDVYNETMDRDSADSYYYFGEEFYDSILNDLSENAQIFYAVYEDKMVAASIFLMANGKINYHLSGYRAQYARLASTNLLLYEVAKWGCKNGYQSLYLGGGVGSEEDSLFRFKKAFYRAEDSRRFVIGKKIFNHEVYDYLISLRKDLPESEFFPKYRAKG